MVIVIFSVSKIGIIVMVIYVEFVLVIYGGGNGQILVVVIKGGKIVMFSVVFSQCGCSVVMLVILQQDGEVYIGKDMGNGVIIYVCYVQVVDGLFVYGFYVKVVFDCFGNLIYVVDVLVNVFVMVVVVLWFDVVVVLKVIMVCVYLKVSVVFMLLMVIVIVVIFDGGSFFY